MTTSPYWAAVRAELVAHVTADYVSTRPRRRRRWFIGGLATALALAVGTGTAFATGLIQLPGAEHVTVMSAPTTKTGTGTEAVDLGPRPSNSLGVEITISCLSAGSFSFEDGAGGTCAATDVGRLIVSYYLPLASGEHTTTITASTGLHWSAMFQYSRHDATGFAVNARGQTYGVITTDGRVPDLVAVQATNGQQGYVYADQLPSAATHNPTDTAGGSASTTPTIPMYTSDGTTVIGEFAPGG